MTAMAANVVHFTAERVPATVTEIESELHQLHLTDGELALSRIIAAARAFEIDGPFAAISIGTETIVHDSRISSLRPLEFAARALIAAGAAQLQKVIRRGGDC
jgi:hypothetical protein